MNLSRLDKRPIILILVFGFLLVAALFNRFPINPNSAEAQPAHVTRQASNGSSLTGTPARAEPLAPTATLLLKPAPSDLASTPRLSPGISSDTGVYFVNGTTGNNSNPGTESAPWKTVQHSIGAIHPGDTVIIASGIYRLGSVTRFGPAGPGPDRLTTFRAAAGARVILTAANGEAPDIYLAGDYIRLDGLWFGGRFNSSKGHLVATGGDPIGHGKEIVNCTFYGYRGGIVIGSSEYLLIQNNRFVNDGYRRYSHAMYLTGGPKPGQYSQHVIVDHNIIIGKHGGYGAVVFNSASGLTHNFILTRNLVTQQWWGSAAYGSDHLIANNFYWKETGVPGAKDSAWGPQANDVHSLYFNNVMETGGWMTAGFGFPPSRSWTENTYDHNAHQLSGKPPAAIYTITGTNTINLASGSELGEYGVSADQLDAAILALQISFTKPAGLILRDTTIEPNFAVLNLKIPATSPLYQTGNPWFGPSMNIGPDAAVPQTSQEFWNTFRALGLQDYDRFGNPVGTPTMIPTLVSTPTSKP